MKKQKPWIPAFAGMTTKKDRFTTVPMKILSTVKLMATRHASPLQLVTSQQMREIDHRAEIDFGISQTTLMENAGRAIAFAAMDFLSRDKRQKILILCGGGNNGGDGFAAARILKQKGFSVEIILMKPVATLKGATLKHFKRARRLKMLCSILPKFVKIKEKFSGSSLLIDALLGTGLNRNVTGEILKVIELVNQSKSPVLAVDIPSGLDADKGIALPKAVKAKLTVTMGALKKGMIKKSAKKFVGEIRIADIGFPKELLSW